MAYKTRDRARSVWGRIRFGAVGIGAYVDPHAILTGTGAGGITEDDVITGAKTFIITLSGANWVASGTKFNAQRQAIIDGIKRRDTQAEGLGAIPFVVTNVVRTSATVVTVTCPAAPLFNISSDEVWYFEIPPTAVVNGGPFASADISVTVSNVTAKTVTAAITGTAQAGGVLESEIVTGSQTIIITLTGSTFVAAGSAAFNTIRDDIINGIVSGGSEAGGFNAIVKPLLLADLTTVVRTGNSIVTVTLPAAASYSISVNETLTVTVPRYAIVDAEADVVATPTLPITANS